MLKNKFRLLSAAFIILLVFVSFSNSIHAVDSLECVHKWVKNTSGNLERSVSSEFTKNNLPPCSSIQTSTLGFQIPSLGDILTFAIRAFFVIAGIAALFYMLIGAFSWVTSGGEEEAVTGARNKIQAAIVGMILIVGVLAIIWTLEQVIFNRRICLGLSCTLTLPGLVKVTDDGAYCCVCLNQSTNARGQIINTSKYRCNDAGMAVAL